uniref:Variant surface glycoprotein n=1 Tax=Trypanosoma brucei TaxID=5691 RepID=A0A1V0FZT6_9TRYP|nr:variant surface glycoprotein [Trypanosoma brucei]
MITKIKLVTEEKFKQETITATAAAKSALATGTANTLTTKPGFATDSTSICNTACLGAKAGVATLTLSTKPVQLFTSDTVRGECKQHKTATSWKQLSTDATLDAVCQASTSNFDTSKLLLKLSYGSLKNNQQLAKIILLLRGTNDKKGEAAQAKAADIVPAVIGSDPSSFDTNIIQFVTQIEHTFTVRGNEIKGTLLKLAVSTSNANILARLKGETAKDAKIASTQAPVTTKKTETNAQQ